jgi:ribosomal protein L40E
MRTRPHSAFVQKLKARRCSKCGAKLNPQKTRCRRCHKVALNRPKK